MKAKTNLRAKIQKAMRQNEIEVLAHLRKYRVTHTTFLRKSWHNALDRLLAAAKVDWSGGCLVPKKGAGPVTPAVR